ncbi:MAG: 30S ribosomal protein S6 [Minisyncoccia bacterium]
MEKTENTQVYEVGYHIASSVSEENVAAEVAGIKKILGKVEIISEENPKLIDLAYTIAKPIGGLRRKFDKAYFGWIKFSLPTDEIVELKKKLDGVDNIIRFLLVKTVAENTLCGAKLIAEEISKKKTYTKKEEKVVEKTAATIEEIDKTIDDLIKE